MSLIDATTRIQKPAAGFDPEALGRLERHLQTMIEEEKLQCASYLIAQNGSVSASNAFGPLTHASDSNELQMNSIRRVASVTKLFTTVAIFQLIEQGKLFLRQSVSEWIEEFKHPMYEKIQIWHLLTHTSGVQADPSYFQEPYPMGWWNVLFAFEPDTKGRFAVTDAEEAEKMRRSAWIKAVLSGKPIASPGEQWMYSSAGYSMLGEIITRASGKPYEQYIIEEIAQPLGMSRTFFEVPKELHHEVCVTNDYDVQRLEKKGDRTYAPPRAGGGLYSTLEDLFRFGQMFLNGGHLDGVRVLSRKSIEKMSQNTLGSGIPAHSWGAQYSQFIYGIGTSLTRPDEWLPQGSYGHEGAGRSKLLIDPIRQAVTIYFLPSNIDWCPEAIDGTHSILGSGWL
ncbi:serine hydrolase domain-containing protein [Paenibacillus radicis (ex Gao et al. 2016)]|uniref:Beta-lactamase-related domain-containing protein n=1 Tax=Paenibacillus radicis (ex Gao et al. 2016) TaxID=1737354 RepID=A0A917M363_9BACL|nr:serine hydrolase [Paenibacillus radicis (ex Gao et al. 2016)]GGG74024.1 hypothetical protein GCM10010918_32640 [Paenibacillus radicis (ex Gao et al. 2016)]